MTDLVGQIHHILKLLRHLKSRTSSAGSTFISLSGPEKAQALSQNLSGPGERNASSITGASSTGFSFYWGGPLQRPGPLSLHIRVPTPVIWPTSAKAPFHSRCSSLFLLSHLSLFLSFSLSAPCRSITFLTSNEEWTCFENYDVISRSKLQMKRTFSGLTRDRAREDVQRFHTKAASVCACTVWLSVPSCPIETEQSAIILKLVAYQAKDWECCCLPQPLNRKCLDLLNDLFDHLNTIGFLLLLHFPPKSMACGM